MRYLAFDIESIDGMFREGNICEFGYVLADETFDIIEQDNIIIRPIIMPKYLNKRIPLTYSLSDYRKADSFLKNYQRIYDLLCADDVMVVGHAVHNDVFCVNMACVANNVPLPKYNYIDSQIVFAIYKGENKLMGLDKIASELDKEFFHHRADEDARVSLLSLQYVMEKTGYTFVDVLAHYHIELGVNDCGDVSACRTVLIQGNAPSIDSKSSKRKLLNAFMEKLSPSECPIILDSTWQGKRFFMSNKTAIIDLDLTRRLLQAVADNGGRIAYYANAADYIITDESDEIEAYEKLKAQCLTINDAAKLFVLPQMDFDNKAILEQYVKEQKELKDAERVRQMMAIHNRKKNNIHVK